ncbi:MULTISPECIES: hypothetical protein [Pseudomonas]|uniref:TRANSMEMBRANE PROTEIN n=2 Tax=Pseudomonas TaxID=286 RepID=A0AA94EHS2_9PSED|nr:MULTISPECIES: hypothetical protein [Pseudomonas]MBT9263384.1 hypothetical protein [Pseudomonas sp. MG-9]RVD74572.1 hypothetical protein A9HBioS_5553 [Pseudomonas koreensis]WDR37839.1 hypothetical protein NN484_08900 [Pseudomonas serboccidentalis]
MKKRVLVTLTLLLALSGCHSNVRNSSPSLLKDGIQLHQDKVVVDAQHAKVIMKSSGGTYPVEFSIRRADDPDQRMEVLGTVVDSGRGKVFGWIANLNEVANSATVKRFPQLEAQADADKPFEVSGYSNSRVTAGIYTCGPLKTTFTPQRGKVYQVEFQFNGELCEQHVYDVTQPQQRIPVAG